MTAALCLCLATFCASESLHAQSLPLPALPKAVPSPPSPDQPDWQATRRWEYALGLAPGYDTNVEFVNGGAGDSVLTPSGELVRIFPGTNGLLRVRGAARGFVYSQETVWNRVDGELGLTSTRNLSPRTTWRTDLLGALGHTDSNSVLDAQGVLLPLSQTRSFEGLTDVVFQTGTRNTVRIGARAYYTDFDDPELVDSLSSRGLVSFSRSLSERSTLYARYDFEYSQLGTSFASHFGSLQWDRVLTRSSSVLLEGGVSYSTSRVAPEITATWSPYGGVTFAQGVGQTRTVIYVRRETVPAFGLGGIRQVYRFGLRTSIPIGRAWIDLEGTHVRRTFSRLDELPLPDPSNDRESLTEATCGMRRRVGRRYVLGLQARYRRRGPQGPDPSVDGILASLSLTFANPGAGGI